MAPVKDSLLSHFHLEVGGQALPEAKRADLLDITVESSLHLPDMVIIRLSDPEFEWIDSDTFKMGAEIIVTAGYESSNDLKRIFCGEVTAVEMDLNAATTPTVLVRGYDRSHRLMKGRQSRSFLNMKDSELASKVAGEAGLSCKSDATATKHEYIFQNNQTNWEFIQERARRNGFECFVDDQKQLHFRKPKQTSAPVVPLEWGRDLISFRPRITAARQVKDVTVMGWDPKAKKEIVGKASSPVGEPSVAAQKGPAVAGSVFGGPKMIVVDRPIHSKPEADDMAKSILNELAQDYLTAEGVAYGEPALKAGSQIEIKNLGKKFSGKYYITSATHTWNPDEGYTTSFVVGGRHPQNIADLLAESAGGGDRSGKSVLNPAGGNIVVGVVTNNDDPTGNGRVKVKYPWLVEGHDSHWARLATPMAGPKRGFYWIPEINDEVLIAFEHGDMHRPYVIGCLWNGKDLPIKSNKECVKSSLVNLRLIKTRYGHDIILDDTKGKEKIQIKTPYGHLIEIDDTQRSQLIRVKTKEGHEVLMSDPMGKRFVQVKTKYGHLVRMDDDKRNVRVETPAGHKYLMDDMKRQIKLTDCAGTESILMDGMKMGITIQAGVGGITMKTTGNFKCEAMMNAQLKANIQFQAQGMAMAKLGSNGMTTVEAAGMTMVKGALVKIN